MTTQRTVIRCVCVLSIVMTGFWRPSFSADCEIPKEVLETNFTEYFEHDVDLAPHSMEGIRLRVLPVRACKVTLRTQIPFPSMVFMETDSGWRLIRENSIPVEDWNEILLEALGENASSAAVLSKPGDVASDFSRLLVNADERYGVVLRSLHDIPWDYNSSDIFRDLEREGHDKEQIRRELLADVPLWILPPALIDFETGPGIQFFTWSYFGGDVIAWRLSPNQARMSYRVVATQVGSFDYYH